MSTLTIFYSNQKKKGKKKTETINGRVRVLLHTRKTKPAAIITSEGPVIFLRGRSDLQTETFV